MKINVEIPEHIQEIMIEKGSHFGFNDDKIIVTGTRFVKKVHQNEPIRYRSQIVDKKEFVNEIIEEVFRNLTDEGIKKIDKKEGRL